MYLFARTYVAYVYMFGEPSNFNRSTLLPDKSGIDKRYLFYVSVENFVHVTGSMNRNVNGSGAMTAVCFSIAAYSHLP